MKGRKNERKSTKSVRKGIIFSYSLARSGREPPKGIVVDERAGRIALAKGIGYPFPYVRFAFEKFFRIVHRDAVPQRGADAARLS